ncbi:hypothetical protein ACTOV4_16375 [Brucella sp. C7-11G]
MNDQTLKTSYDHDPIMYASFVGCLHWALGDKKIVDRYREETGDNFSPASSPEARMIDQVTGADIAFLQRFSDWVEKNIFGSPDQVFGEDA